MWKAIDKITPAGTSHADLFQGKAVAALWLIAGAILLLALWLIIDSLLAWSRNRSLRHPDSKHLKFHLLRKFLAWLFYPSFQARFKSEE